MKKIGLLVLSAVLLMSCSAQTPSVSSTSSKAAESSQSEATSSVLISSEDSSEPAVSSEPATSSEPETSSESIPEASSEPVISSEPEVSSESEVSSEPAASSEEALPNDGSAEHPFTVTEAYNVAATLAAGANTEVGYYISGIVDGDISWFKGRLSFNITDGEQTLYVYNMNNEENKASYKDGEFDLKNGDALTVTGALKNYNGTLEICYVKNVADCYRIA